MKNNKQDLLTIIRIDMNLLKYEDKEMIETFGKTYEQISKMNYEEVKEIKTQLHKIYSEMKGE